MGNAGTTRYLNEVSLSDGSIPDIDSSFTLGKGQIGPILKAQSPDWAVLLSGSLRNPRKTFPCHGEKRYLSGSFFQEEYDGFGCG